MVLGFYRKRKKWIFVNRGVGRVGGTRKSERGTQVLAKEGAGRIRDSDGWARSVNGWRRTREGYRGDSA